MTKELKSIEKNLLIGIKQGNHYSFKSLFELYSVPLYQFSNSYLKSKEAAEDVVQEVFTILWNKRENLRTDSSFKSYLFTIAVNAIRKRFNSLVKVNQVKHDLILEYSANNYDLDENGDYQMLLDKLDVLIERMPEKRKQVFVKKKLENKSAKEISDELGISVKTVEYHISEGMKFLKSEFARLQTKGLIFYSLFII
jgi:RNA polymerase sigma-70 factor (ECF subfamily)